MITACVKAVCIIGLCKPCTMEPRYLRLRKYELNVAAIKFRCQVLYEINKYVYIYNFLLGGTGCDCIDGRTERWICLYYYSDSKNTYSPKMYCSPAILNQ